MGTITSSGVGSGIDIESLVTKLVDAEGSAAKSRLNTREATLQARLSAFGIFKSTADQVNTALAALKDLSKFQAFSASSADETILKASASSTAVPASYDVEVVQLAQAAKLTSDPFDPIGTMGTGTLTVTYGTTSFDVVIDGTNNTLSGIAGAINAATGNPGVNASVINTAAGSRLILTGASSGAANTVSVVANGALTPLNLVSTQTAQDAIVKIDTFEVRSATNAISSAVTGVTFNAQKVSTPGVTTRITVAADPAAAKKSIEDFVKAYNTMTTTLSSLDNYNADTRQASALTGDSTLRNFLAAVRREAGTVLTGAGLSFKALTDIGITTKVDGTLEINSSKLTTSLATGVDKVGKLFAGADGLGGRLGKLIDGYTGATGLLQARTQGLQNGIKDIDSQRTALEARLSTYETRIRAQLSAMDALVAQLRATGDNLQSSLDGLLTSLKNS
jgi:flagellar hook-associated protein 2